MSFRVLDVRRKMWGFAVLFRSMFTLPKLPRISYFRMCTLKYIIVWCLFGSLVDGGKHPQCSVGQAFWWSFVMCVQGLFFISPQQCMRCFFKIWDLTFLIALNLILQTRISSNWSVTSCALPRDCPMNKLTIILSPYKQDRLYFTGHVLWGRISDFNDIHCGVYVYILCHFLLFLFTVKIF